MDPSDFVALVDSLAALPYGREPVDQRSHALQTAGLAIQAGADDELVVAAVLHDVANAPDLAPRFRGIPHEEAGARFCEPWLGARVAWLVGAHVPAKRYLVATDPDYGGLLSAGSVHSLRMQGGGLTEAEASRFREHPSWEEAVALRRWDDGAKVPGADAPDGTDLIPRFERVLRSAAVRR